MGVSDNSEYTPEEKLAADSWSGKSMAAGTYAPLRVKLDCGDVVNISRFELDREAELLRLREMLREANSLLMRSKSRASGIGDSPSEAQDCFNWNEQRVAWLKKAQEAA